MHLQDTLCEGSAKGKETGVRGNQTCQQLDLGGVAPRIQKKYIPFVETIPSLVFCFSILAN